jgi:8-oxo-dGTP pyrophosphatase MutT (NUDIX family)
MKSKGPVLDRQDPKALAAYIDAQRERLGCKRLIRKRWTVPKARAEKGLRTRMGVGALIWDDKGRVLLVRHHPRTGWDPEKWFTPGGVIEEGELPEVALRREIKEEVGLAIDILALSRINNEILVYNDIEASTYFFQFEVRARPGKPIPHEGEILEAKWFDALPKDMAFREDYIEDFKARARLERVKHKR